MQESEPSQLSRFERAALSLARFTNETPLPKQLQMKFVRTVSQAWIRRSVNRRTYVDGVDGLLDLAPDRGVVLVSNHRSFFDMYVVMLGLYESGAEWPKRLFFPVRATFFYERPLGVLVNFAVGGGSMYPPVFRDRAKADRNKQMLETTARLLDEPGSLVGLHPEGTRNKGDDPYTLLPAQPGIGQVILAGQPMVIPVFVNGLSNDILGDIRKNFRPDVRRENPVIISYGRPIDYADLASQKPRPTLYKKMADRCRDEILALSRRERDLRDACARGEVTDADPNWLDNRSAAVRG